MTLKITLLGCGSSGGVPRLGEKWGACDPLNPKNRRQRCSALIEKKNTKGTTRVLIDTSPDMRDQLLSAGIGELDAVLYTHAHADHVHGLDDLRMIVINMRKRLPVWADAATKAGVAKTGLEALSGAQTQKAESLSKFGSKFGQSVIDGKFSTSSKPVPFVTPRGGMVSGPMSYLK